jgi:hypothetical protein
MKPISIFPYIHLGAINWHLARLSGIVDAKGETGILPVIKRFQAKPYNFRLTCDV